LEKKMRNLFLLLFVVLFACSSGPGETVNFGGEWALDVDNSDMGGRPGGERAQRNPDGQQREGGDEQGNRQGRRGGGFNAPEISISQTEELLTITRTFVGRDDEKTTSEEKYNLKGKKSINESRMGEKTSTAKWDKSGKTLIVKSEQTMDRGDQVFTIESTEKWTLINEYELEIESIMSTPRGERIRKLLYTKN
jgi:hypothetical protein